MDKSYIIYRLSCRLEYSFNHIGPNTQKETVNISEIDVRNLIASIARTLGENCGVVYDKFRHVIVMAWRRRASS